MKNLKFKKLALIAAIALILPTTVVEAHSTEAHTKSQIKQKYDNSISYDYTKSEFNEIPSDKAPYAAGSLQEGVINDVISRINYYRWLYGIDDISVRRDKLERNQKGAVIQSALNQLTHTPQKPADMDDAFYQEAYKGCYAGAVPGDTYSGNISFGDRYLYEAIDGFVSDLANVGYGVGHRLSVLDPRATQASFGKCGAYSTLSVFFEFGASAGTEDFYTYPSAGYFPTEHFITNELWHIYTTKNVNIKSIQFKYNGQVYDAIDLVPDDNDPVLTFKMPNELINQLGGNGEKIPSNTTIDVIVNGSENYNYTVNFFDMNKILTSISLNKENLTIGQGKTETLSLTLNPANADVSEKAVWKSDNEDVATVDENGTVTAVNAGTANISVTLEGFTKTCKVTVTEKTEVSLDKTSVSLNITDNKTATLEATVLPESVSSDSIVWNSSNIDVVTVSGNGRTATITAVGKGTADVTVSINGEVAICHVAVSSAPLTDITLSNPPEDTVMGGQIKFTVTPNEGAEIAADAIVWETSNPDVAVVDSDGTVHLLKEGEVTITARVGDSISDSKTFTVTAKPLENNNANSENGTVGDSKTDDKAEKQNNAMPNTGDITIATFIVLMAVSGLGIMVMIKKKKTVKSKH